MVLFYCISCQEHRHVKIESLKADDLNKGKDPWGDIVCENCHLVIATISAKQPGIYEFQLKVSDGEIQMATSYLRESCYG